MTFTGGSEAAGYPLGGGAVVGMEALTGDGREMWSTASAEFLLSESLH
jgi:hypothetical protein